MITLVVPSLDGPTTGGTLYNRCLARALHERGEPYEVLAWDAACSVVGEARPRVAWVDSLWIDRLPELVGLAAPQCKVGLLTHYLPSLVAHGERPPPSSLSRAERDALTLAEAFVVPSEYLATELEGLGVARRRVLVVPPGTELPCAPRPPRQRSSAQVEHAPLHALVIANVTEGKGILALLEGLGLHLRPHDALQLDVVGDLAMDPAHARACTEHVASTPSLRARVRLLGAQPYPACIESLLEADVLLSASRMESYGMALADARACGRPILARAGGNVAAHVDAAWGGELVADALALASACVALARDTELLAERQRRAWQQRSSQPWAESAARLVSASRDWPAPRPPQ